MSAAEPVRTLFGKADGFNNLHFYSDGCMGIEGCLVALTPNEARNLASALLQYATQNWVK